MKFDTAIFDLDGTLLNTLGDLTDAVNAALSIHGFPQRSEEEVRQRIGNGAARLLSLAVPTGTEEETIASCLTAFKAHYGQHLTCRTMPYEGIVDILNALQADGLKLAVVTNKPEPAARTLTHAYFGDLPTFGDIAGRPRKPDPASVQEALAVLGRDKTNAAFIGDSAVDIATAKNAGLYAVGVAWGFRPQSDLTGADVLVHSAQELYFSLTGKNFLKQG